MQRGTIMQRPLAGLLALVAIASLSACSGDKKDDGAPPVTSGGKTSSAGVPQAGKKGHNIVFIFKSVSQYSETCKKGAEQADAELKANGGTVKYLAPDKPDVSQQISMMDQAIADKVDAIVIAPNDPKAIVPIVKKAIAAGVKVYTWDSDAPDTDRTFYVAAVDDVQVGVDIADALAKDIGEKGKVQIATGGRGAANTNLHVKGMEEGFKKYPGITLVQPYIYNEEDIKKSVDFSKAAFQKDPDIVGFAGANSQAPPGAGVAVTELNKIGKVKVWGLALPSETKTYLKSGAISGVILWDPTKLTYLTAILVNNDLNGQPPKDGDKIGDSPIKVNGKFVVVPSLTFNKDNVDQYNF